MSAASTLVISDIDDTIKISHVKNYVDIVLNSYDTDMPFKGMPQLYRFLKKELAGPTFSYVSNAPSWLMSLSHSIFISRNFFPSGRILLKGKYPTATHKINSIKELIKSNHPNRLILLGDNGELDSEIYHQIVTEIKSEKLPIETIQFIRQIYNDTDTKELYPEQIPFVTDLDIISELNKRDGFVENKGALLKYATKRASEIMIEEQSDDSTQFPQWYSCLNYQVQNSLEENGVIADALDHVRKICTH